MIQADRMQYGVSMWVCALALMGLPMSVFAQEAATEAAEIQQKPAYRLETIPGDEVLGDFVVGPGKTELRLQPGETVTTEILITNRTGESRVFNFETEDVVGTTGGDIAVKLLGDDRGPYSLRDYLEVPTEGIPLKHAERARVPVTVSIPADAEPGGLYGSVLVTTVTKDVADTSSTNAVPKSPIVSRIGTLFFITVPGAIAYEGVLQKFATIPDASWFDGGPIHFELLYANTGSVHVNPYGELSITNMFGEEVGFIEIEPWFALPQSLRFREVVWSREFLFGKYTATARINRGYDDIIDEMDVTFWVLPWKVLLMVCVVVFMIVFLIRMFFTTFEFKRKV